MGGWEEVCVCACLYVCVGTRQDLVFLGSKGWSKPWRHTNLAIKSRGMMAGECQTMIQCSKALSFLRFQKNATNIETE